MTGAGWAVRAILVLALGACSEPAPDPPPLARPPEAPSPRATAPVVRDAWSAFLARCGDGPLPDVCASELRALAPTHRDQLADWARASACAQPLAERCRLARSVLAAQGDLGAATVLARLETDPTHPLLQSFAADVLLALWRRDCGHSATEAALCPWLIGVLAARGELRPREQTQARQVQAAIRLLASTDPAEHQEGERRWRALQDPPAVPGMLHALASDQLKEPQREKLRALLRGHREAWAPQLREVLKAGSLPAALTAARLGWDSNATETTLAELRHAEEARAARERSASLMPRLRALEGQKVVITLTNNTVRTGTLLGVHGDVVNLARSVKLMGQRSRVTTSVSIAEIREVSAAPQ